jgi:hypothetical protein
VFVLDFFRDLPASLSLYRYATEYYARYPCLGLVQYPPVFAVVEAALFGLFGVSMATARASVAAFAALGAVFGYLVARRSVGRWGAAVFVLLCVTAPLVVYWSRDVMLEIPVMAMMLASSYFFLGYVEEERRGFGVTAAVFLALAVLTKQTACCLAPAWVAYAVWRRGWRILWRKESLLGAAVAVVLLVPFGVLTVLYSPVNVGQTVGRLSAGVVTSRWSLASVCFYPRRLPEQVGLLCLVGIGVLLVGAAVRRVAGRAALGPPERLRGVLYGALWTAACYALLTFAVIHKDPRFILIWVPGLALLGAAGVAWLAEGGSAARAGAVLVTALLAAQAVACGAGWRHDPWACPAPYVAGTAEAARRLAASSPGTVVFYSGNFNGNFIFNVRCFDPGRNLVVLRDSKLLYTIPTMRSFGVKVHVAGRDDILKVLRDYGVRYLLVEDPTPELDRIGPVIGESRALMRSRLFVQRGVYPIASSEALLARRLYFYEFLQAGPAQAEVLRLDVPASGRVIEVPLRRLGVRTAASLGTDARRRPGAPPAQAQPWVLAPPRTP